uniref:Uncharacterized protein n=1 Tax=Trichobilharzia regenti TaxID=157069 RepID=A0AA85IW43_TRIRE|nr:unnamed protein product [Trichobilharzia regenti]
MNRKSKNLLSSFSNFTAPPVVTGGVTSISNTGQQLVNNFSTGSSSLFSPNTLAAFYLYYQQHQLQQSQEHNQSSLSSSTTLHQHLSHEQPNLACQSLPYLLPCE